MSVCIHYRSLGLILPKHIADIVQDAERLASSREWWAEPISFFPPDLGDDEQRGIAGWIASTFYSLLGVSGGILEGDTKISLAGGYTGESGEHIEVDAEENELMGYLDTWEIVQFLGKWSKTCGVGWQLSCVGEDCGRITAQGGIEPQLHEFLSSFLEQTRFDSEDPRLAELARQISSKYASRW